MLSDYIELFQLKEKIPDQTDYVLKLEKEKKFTDCANIAACFSLQMKVNLKELLTKLLIQSDMIHAKKVVNSSNEYKGLLIELLSSTENCKKAAELIKEYGFSIFDFPQLIVELQRRSIRCYINALCHPIVKEQIPLSQVIELIEKYKSLQMIMLDDLIYRKMYKEAWIVLNHFKLFEYLPSEVCINIKGKVSNPDDILIEFNKETIDPFGPLTEDCFILQFKFEEVILVNDDIELEKVQPLLKSDLVGIDIEWKPSLMTLVDIKPSILQICSEKVFAIFDLLKLEGSAKFDEFIKTLFMSMSILKLGLGLKEDMKLLCVKYPHIQSFHHIFSYIDISDFYKEQNPYEKQSSLVIMAKKLLSNYRY